LPARQTGGYDTQRDAFLGAYRSWDSPAAGGARQVVQLGGPWLGADGLASCQTEPQAGRNQGVIFLLGYHENPVDQKFDPPGSQTINKKTVKPLIAKYLDGKNASAAFQTLREYWDSLLGIYQCNHPTPTPTAWSISGTPTMHGHLQHVPLGSFYESGIGRGLGFRDSNQDLLGFVQMVPARARERTLDLAATQLKTAAPSPIPAADQSGQ